MERIVGSPFGPDDPVPDRRQVDDYLGALDRRRFHVRGMFVRPVVESLGNGDFEAVRGYLLEPPREHYLPFRVYPQHDHALLLSVLGKRKYPELTHAEAMRRLARDDFHVFVQSMLGKVLLAMSGNARTALMRLPTIYENAAPSEQRVTVEVLDDGRVQIDFEPLPGIYAYQLGQLEEIVRHWGSRPSIDIFSDADAHFRFVIEL